MNLIHLLLTLTLTTPTTAQTSTFTLLPFPSEPADLPGVTFTCYAPFTNHHHLYGSTGVTIWQSLPEILPQLSGFFPKPHTQRTACWNPPNPNFRVVFTVTSGVEGEGGFQYPVYNDGEFSERVFRGVLERCRPFGGKAVVREGGRWDWVFMIQSEPGQCADFDDQTDGK